ncbi:MAG: transferase hexapeptide repeat containing protein [Verrucomicrobiales bacterium]|nr:transferase hexapeptide repeat containing protein [Verrucomicrobiales bacterium]
MKKPLIIWGASGHAKVLRDFLTRSDYQLEALFDNSVDLLTFDGVPVHTGKEGFLEWRRRNPAMPACGAVAIGGARGLDRVRLQRFFTSHGIEIINAIHPSAILPRDCQLGLGSQILAGAVVGVEVVLGEGCIINTKASVDHESILGDGCHLAPGATLAGCVEVGSGTLIAVGATVLPRIKIGSNAIVGAGSVVTRDVPDNAVVMGQPARVVRWLAPPQLEPVTSSSGSRGKNP